MNKKIIYTSQAPKAIGPYSQAVYSNHTLYVSGQIALDGVTGQMFQEDIKAETVKVMDNIAMILQAADMDFRDVVKTSIFCTDLKDFAAINETYGSYFGAHPPARETVQVAALPRGANVEISVIAVK
jgi:2-iminobutanoate/2-iminopropanoate deaminase